MSSNVTFLALGMVIAGRLTEAMGPRWIWGAAAILSTAAAVVGFTLARGVPAAPPQPIESPGRLDAESAVEAHSESRQRAI
jgi:hypothetical protein